MSASPVVTLGFGTGGSPSLVVTFGFGIDATVVGPTTHNGGPPICLLVYGAPITSTILTYFGTATYGLDYFSSDTTTIESVPALSIPNLTLHPLATSIPNLGP